MIKPVFLYTKLKLHWGFIVRQIGASATQSSYPLPPPTTIVGAYTNALARIFGIPDAIDDKRRKQVINKAMECSLRATIAAGAGLIGEGPGVVVYDEPSRITGPPYKGGGSYEKAVKKPIYESVTELLPVQAVGQASSPNATIVTAWLMELAPLENCLESTVSKKDLVTAAHSIYRIGSKEGLASVIDARVYTEHELEWIDTGFFKSIFYQPAECSEPIDPGTTVSILLPNHLYVEVLYNVPASVGSGASLILPSTEGARFRLRANCHAVRPREFQHLTLSYRG